MAQAEDQIGPYTLISKLGRGSFGVVWLAEKRTRYTSTKFALKLPRDEDLDIETIKHEAKLWEKASGHPNVLPIIEADDYDGQIVIVSEYAPDGSLRDWMERHEASLVAEAVEMISGILAGLEHLHKQNIIHRDIKPDNILLQGTTPRLADFGIARVLKTTNQSSAVLGTPAYMAPEGFDGIRSAQTDLWAVGVIFYQMLSGKLPFAQTDMAALLSAIITKEPEPLPSHIPLRVREIIRKTLSKDPSARFRSAGEMRKALSENPRKQNNSGSDETKLFPTMPAPSADPQATLPSPAISPTGKSNEAAAPTIASFFTPTDAGNSAPPVTGEKKSRNKFWLVIPIFILLAGCAAAIGFFATGWNGNGQETQTAETKTIQPKTMSNKNGMEFVLIPAGSFVMGSSNGADNERPTRQVTIQKDFYIGRYEITQSEWQRVMGNNPSYFRGDNFPVEQVSWNDVQAFVKKLNESKDGYVYRLPSEAEWEYACRAGTTGNFAGVLDEMAWYGNNSGRERLNINVIKKSDDFGKIVSDNGNQTHSVGGKQPNAWGLYDMHGNVSEWCEDMWHKNYNDAPSNGNAWVSDDDGQAARIVRGGMWAESPAEVRSAARFWFEPEKKYNSLGVRLVAAK